MNNFSKILPLIEKHDLFPVRGKMIIQSCTSIDIHSFIGQIHLLLNEQFFSTTDIHRISLILNGMSNEDICLSENINTGQLGRLKKKIGTAQEMLFLWKLSVMDESLNPKSLKKVHSYFDKLLSAMQSGVMIKHLKVSYSDMRREWMVESNEKSCQNRSFMKPIHMAYKNPYQLALDIYEALEMKDGPLKLQVKHMKECAA